MLFTPKFPTKPTSSKNSPMLLKGMLWLRNSNAHAILMLNNTNAICKYMPSLYKYYIMRYEFHYIQKRHVWYDYYTKQKSFCHSLHSVATKSQNKTRWDEKCWHNFQAQFYYCQYIDLDEAKLKKECQKSVYKKIVIKYVC